MKLFDIPAETLALITCHLHYLDLANLWFSGHARLNTRLAAGTPELSIVFNSDLRGFSWPPLFNRFSRLTSFVLKDLGSTSTLTSLPNFVTSLRKMHIEVWGAFSLFHEVLCEDPSAFAAMQDLEIAIATTETPTRGAGLHWPQNLVRLQIQPQSQFELDLDLSSLPSQLTALTGAFSKIINPAACFPASLMELQLAISGLAPDPVPLLPEGLLSLQLSIVYRYNPDAADETPTQEQIVNWTRLSIPFLPRSLTRLRMPFDDLKRADLLLLPRNLTRLENPLVKQEDFDLLPPMLVAAYCCELQRNPVKKSSCKHLPKALKKVSAEPRAVPYLTVPTVHVFGPNKDLVEEMCSLGLQHLPIEITALQLGKLAYFPLEFLPPKLTKFTCPFVLLEPYEISQLPETVLHLHIGQIPDIEGWKQLPPRLERLELNSSAPLPVESSLWMPRSIQYLSTSAAPLSLPWFDKLPENLHSLFGRITQSWVPEDVPHSSSSSVLPNSALSWRINFPVHLSRLHLQIEFTSTIWRTNVIQNVLESLPPNLRELHLSDNYLSSETTYAAAALKKLPNRLLSAELPPMAGVDMETVKKVLPKAIQKVTIGMETLGWTSEEPRYQYH